MGEQEAVFEFDRSVYDDHNAEDLRYKSLPGLTEELVREISASKNEPEWMLAKRLEGLEWFHKLPMPTWGPSLDTLDLSKIHLFLKPNANHTRSWEEVPSDIKSTFDKLGIPESEKRSLAGVGAQYESEIVYHNLKKEWEDQGVIFSGFDEAVRDHPELVKKYFMNQCVPVNLHKFAALHAAVWSGGSFVYVPKGVKLTMPLQAYFRMNSKSAGQFEHTLIIVDEGAEAHYIEGCSAPRYVESSMHAGCVEVFVLQDAHARYSSVENWSKNTYNLNTKRAIAYENGFIEWVNGNMRSCVTMLYPNLVLLGDNSKSDFIGIAFAGAGQNQDTGAKIVHIGKNTSSTTISKSISKDGGISTYRGLLSVKKNAANAKASVKCDALMIDSISTSNTYPHLDIHNDESEITHEASVGKVNPDQIFYLMSRGISEDKAIQMIVSGFVEPLVKELPLEYAIEFNRLIQLEMEGSLG